MSAIDAIKGVWIVLVFSAVFICVPLRLKRGTHSSTLSRVLGVFVRSILIAVVLVSVLNRLKLLGVIALVGIIGFAAGINWIGANRDSETLLRTQLQSIATKVFRYVEECYFGLRLVRRREREWNLAGDLVQVVASCRTAMKGKELYVAALVIAGVMTLLLQMGSAFQELRLHDPDDYVTTLRARELMLNVTAHGGPVIFSAIAATTSLLSGCDALEVVRFLVPVLRILVILCVALLIHCTRAQFATVATLYVLGASAIPHFGLMSNVPTSFVERLRDTIAECSSFNLASSEFNLAVLFAAIGLLILADWNRNSMTWTSLVDFGCCVALAALISQVTGFILLLSAAVLLIRPWAGLATLIAGCYGLTVFGVLSKPTLLSHDLQRLIGVVTVLAAGLCLALIEKRVITPWHAETIVIVLGCVVGFLWFRPHTFTAQPLEYDATARQTQVIANSFARQKWTLVAPVEQLPESFGLGGHLDLGEFVEKYRGRTSPPAFSFPNPGQTWFIYVEKIPFQIFSREPESVPFSMLIDPAYRNYRSPGGRASLEADALRICEEYRQAHSDMNVFFENDAVRIYQVHEAPDLSNPEQVAAN